MELLEIILYQNIFELHGGYFKQNIGAAMGSRPIPPYANNFMAKNLHTHHNENQVKDLKCMKVFWLIALCFLLHVLLASTN